MSRIRATLFSLAILARANGRAREEWPDPRVACVSLLVARSLRSLARASRQSAIMPRFKYLNGSFRVPARHTDASPTRRAAVACQLRAKFTTDTCNQRCRAEWVAWEFWSSDPAGWVGEKSVCARVSSVTTSRCAVFVYGQQKKDATALFYFCVLRNAFFFRKCCERSCYILSFVTRLTELKIFGRYLNASYVIKASLFRYIVLLYCFIIILKIELYINRIKIFKTF